MPAEVPALEIESKDEYYLRLGISELDVLVLPDCLEACLDSYFGLDVTEQDVALRWCHWLNHARQVAPLSPSASVIAAVQSIEALLPRTGASIGQRFKAFLEEYAPGDAAAGARNQLYGLRSKLTHSGTLLVGELRHLAFRDFAPQSWGQRDVADRALMVARLAGVNWLLTRR